MSVNIQECLTWRGGRFDDEAFNNLDDILEFRGGQVSVITAHDVELYCH